MMAQELSAAGLRSAGSLAATGGPDRLLPVAEELRQLLPGLRRGSTVAVAPGASSLLLALLAEASAAGSWAAVVGMPDLHGVAAAQAGVALERLALVPYPGPEWGSVVSALLDGVDLVAVAPPAGVSDRVASRLAARARLRGAVLLPYGSWPGADVVLAAEQAVWEGLGAGRGRLRGREVTIVARGRRRGGPPGRVRVQLPDSAGRLAAASVPGSAVTGPSMMGPSRVVSNRPELTLIPGGGGEPAESTDSPAASTDGPSRAGPAPRGAAA